MMDFWSDIASPAPSAVTVNGVAIARGSRVRVRPHAAADAMDLLLAGRAAIVEGIDQDHAGAIRLAVTLEDDPGRDLGDARQPGHRFFFAPDEVEPLDAVRRVLVAGIGNVFLGDDGFGVAVAHRLATRALPPGVLVADFGIRGLDLAYALQDYDEAILVDATPRGGRAGTLYVIEPERDAPPAGPPVDAHGMDPTRVLALARRLGRLPPRLLLVGCEPLRTADEGPDDVVAELSEPVRGRIDEAVALIESLLSSTDERPGKVVPP